MTEENSTPKTLYELIYLGLKLLFNFLNFFFRDVWTCRICAALAAIWFTSETLSEHVQDIEKLINVFKNLF